MSLDPNSSTFEITFVKAKNDIFLLQRKKEEWMQIP